jgi:hypothetical protein
LQAEINHGELSVFYQIPIESSGKLIQMPQVIYKQILPYFIDVNGIRASYEENELVVKLPFNELHDGFNRKITIDEK